MFGRSNGDSGSVVIEEIMGLKKEVGEVRTNLRNVYDVVLNIHEEVVEEPDGRELVYTCPNDRCNAYTPTEQGMISHIGRLHNENTKKEFEELVG